MKKKFKRLFKRIINTIKKPEMSVLPGQLAFFLVLSIIPLVAVIAAIVTQTSLSIDSLMNLVSDTLPKEVADIINQAIDGKSLNINIVIFYGSAFLLASNGPYSMITISNQIYKVKDKDFLSKQIKSLFMTIIMVVLLLFMLVVPAYGDKIIELIVGFIDNNALINTINMTYSILKYPLSFLLIFFCIKLLYTIAPDTNIKSKDTTYGALFTTFMWIVTTEIYSFYVSQFATYNLLYGSIANIIILLFWVYILSYIFVLGIAMNCSRTQEIAEYEKQRRKQELLNDLENLKEITEEESNED